MTEFNIDWNVTAGTLEWENYTKVQYNDGTSKETNEPQSRDLGFGRNTGTTDITHTQIINFQTETELVNIKQKAQYQDYLRIEPLTSRINVWLSDPSLFNEFQYSMDGENFTDWNTSTQIQVPINKIFYIRGKGLSTADTPRTIKVSGKHFLTGNIRSLFAYENFSKDNNPYTNNCFYGLFKGNTGLQQAQIRDLENANNDNCLPEGCFREMFSGCTSLTRHAGPRAFSASTNSCREMFAGCTSITSSYCNMQYGDAYGFYGMYMNCSNLKSIIMTSCHPYGENAYERMFMNCTSLEDMSKLDIGDSIQDFNDATKECYRLMFYGCTALRKTPVIYTNPNASGAFQQMFAVCESLQEVTVKSTVWDNTRATAYWLQQVPQNGTFKKLAATNIPVGDDYGIPAGWTVEIIE